MAIQWTGLFANTGYSSANNKTQDDAVTGMQDTLYVTGPGYGAYEAIVRLHSSTGAVVASVNVSGGGGAFSAPPPVRFLDNGTTYSYSLEVVRGFIPTEDTDKIIIRLVGGASKRLPSPMSVTPTCDVLLGGAVIAPSVQLPSGVGIQATIDGPITLSTYGDSTDTWYNGKTTDVLYASNFYFDRSAILAEIPASGTNTFQVNYAACPLLYLGKNYRYIGQGGKPGDSTTAIAARNSAAAALDRKSLYDIASLKARVAIVNGLSINDLQSLPEGSDDAALNAMIGRCAEFVKYLSATHELVIWTGLFGFHNPAFPDAQNEMIRGMLIRSHAAMAAMAATLPNVAWINPVGLTCDSSGQWLPGMYASGTVRLHLSQRAARLHGEVIKAILDVKYQCRENATQNYDTVSAWYTVSGGEPTGVDTAAVGSAAIGTRTTAHGVMSVPFTTTADADGAHVLFTALETWMAGGVTGDKFRLIYDYELLDSNGVRLPYWQAQMDVRLVVNTGTCDIQHPYSEVSGGAGCSSVVFELDRDVSTLTAGTVAWLLIKPMRGAGSFTLKVRPMRVLKL